MKLATSLLLHYSFLHAESFIMYNLIMNDLGNTSFVYINKAVIKAF